jgi:L-lactate dehydrogenase (cytochrome)
MARDFDTQYPALDDLRHKAKKRLPHFAFEYLDSSTGREMGARTNRHGLDDVRFMPAILRGALEPKTAVRFMGRDYDYPFGIAPVGMSGLIWPRAEVKLAAGANAARIPYCLSTVAATTPEEVGPIAGDMGWFQLYPAQDEAIWRDILRRAEQAGFDKLVVTVDVPGESRRERQRRARLTTPLRLNAQMIASMMMCPSWSLGMALAGRPKMKLAESYIKESDRTQDRFKHAGKLIRGYPNWDYIAGIRAAWKGHLIVKGVMRPDDAVRLVDSGVDGIWVSNHSARQFEAGPAPIHQLPKIRAAIGDDVPVIFDSGVQSGLDILRAIALGADMVFLGRGFHYALAALGTRGIAHLVHILSADMIANMRQIGTDRLDQLADQLCPSA